MKRLILLLFVATFNHFIAAFGNFHGDFGGFDGFEQLNQERPPEIPNAEDSLDLYGILGVQEEASMRDIKKAFRKLSIEMHPDKNPNDPEATQKFQKLSLAYEVLSDEEKKFLYDQGGMKMVRESEQQVPDHGGLGIFGNLFGGGAQQKSNKGEDTALTLHADLSDLYIGVEKDVQHMRRVVCKGCSGRDYKRISKCKGCSRCPNEKKMVERQMAPGFFVQQEQDVKSKEKCKQELKTLSVTIERGMKSGEQVRFKYMAEQKPNQIPGDVIINVQQKRHKVYERKGDHLHHKMKISLKEALIGFKKVLKHLDGHQVIIDSDEISPGVTFKPFQKLVIKGEGMPVHEFPSQFGDLIITLQIQFPTTLNFEQTEAVSNLF